MPEPETAAAVKVAKPAERAKRARDLREDILVSARAGMGLIGGGGSIYAGHRP